MPDISKQWIDTHPSFHGVVPPEWNKILINRTSRYQNQWINYFFLNKYESDMAFVGLEKERDDFCRQWNLNIPLLQVNNFKELALAFRGCRFFIGNQSMCFALAEAMKIPRILEVCPFAPNVDPVGPLAYDFLYQEYFEYYVEHLSKMPL
jgi:hypothetical protein